MAAEVYSFGPFVLDAGAYRLTRDGAPLSLSPKLIELLAYLAARPAQLVTKEELFEALWPDVIVTDNALTQAVSELRRGIGDRSASPQYIQTVARRGYRFIAPVRVQPVAPAEMPPPGARPRETASLEAYRAAMLGKLELESLDASAIGRAREHFERAIALDPGYAGAHVGLANAYCWQFERSRSRLAAEREALLLAIRAAERAVAIDERHAEAHAVLAFALTSDGRFDEACRAARRAVALAPGEWTHHFRLGHAAWGEERVQALQTCLQLNPDFPFAHLELAMVYVARGLPVEAVAILRDGAQALERQRPIGPRYPACGLHWMLGLIRLAQGRPAEALEELAREELELDRLYGSEVATLVHLTRGHALLDLRRDDEALESFAGALTIDPENARARLGCALLHARRQRTDEAGRHCSAALEAADALRHTGRMYEAAIVCAAARLVGGAPEQAMDVLRQTLAPGVVRGPAGWNFAIEPLFAPLRNRPPFAALLEDVRRRAFS